MVGALHFGPDEGAFEARAEGGADEEVVDAPTYIPGPDTGHRTPPGVMPAVGLEFAEGVEEPGLHESGEPGSFLGREAMVFHVCLGIGEVEFGVRHVEVAAEDDGSLLFKPLEVAEEIAVPPPAVGKPRKFALRVWDIDVHQGEVGVLSGEHATFFVVLGDADAVCHIQWAGLREDSSAGVALLLRSVPVSGVGGWPELLDVIRTGLGFLHAENVGLLGVEVIEEILPQHGAQAVDVPGNQFHGARLTGNGRQTNLLQESWIPFAGSAIQAACRSWPTKSSSSWAAPRELGSPRQRRSLKLARPWSWSDATKTMRRLRRRGLANRLWHWLVTRRARRRQR